MNIVVCVKQIPDPAAPQSLDASHNLNRSGKLILDEADTYGVEMALQLVDKAGTGEVTVVSMGSASDVAGLRNALAMGAAKAVIVSDDALRGTDALGHRQGAGRGHQARELRTWSSPRPSPPTATPARRRSRLAELLGLPSITFAKSVTIDGANVKVERQTESGYDEVTAPLPALVTVTAGVVEPRYASFKGIMAAKSKPLEVLSVADLGLGRPDRSGRRAPRDHRRRRRRVARRG